MTRELQPCGTPGAYQRHRKHGEAPCDACREAKRIESLMRRAKDPDAERKADREGRRRRRAGEYYQPQPCGTPSAFQRHLYNQEEPCGACREGMRVYRREQARRRRKAASDGE